MNCFGHHPLIFLKMDMDKGITILGLANIILRDMIFQIGPYHEILF
jgi:hypothetical protein